MTDSLLRQAAMSALWALDINDRWHYANDEHGGYPESELCDQTQAAIATLRTALAQQAAQPVAFDHDIGADRYQVVKGSFWWHVRIGDSTANVGKFHTKMAAEDMALKLLTAFRDGAFMQSRAAQPVAWGQLGMLNGKTYLRMNYDRTPYPPPADVVRNLNLVPLFAAAQPQQDELQQAKARIDRLETEMRKLRGNLRGVFDRELWDSLDTQPQQAPCDPSCLVAAGGTQDDYCVLTLGECARKKASST